MYSFSAAKVITDRDTGRSRGFGFVHFSSDDSASSALSAMDGQVRKSFMIIYVLYFLKRTIVLFWTSVFQDLQGRAIRVSYANERTESTGRSFGSGGGAGGYRGGGGFGRDRGGDADF